MGGTLRQPGERLAALKEAMAIIRAALDVDQERRVVRSDGPLYPVHRYPAGPPSAHRIQIWIGAMSKGSQRFIGQQADGWIAGGGVSRFAEFGSIKRQIDDAASAAGRNPLDVRRIVNCGLDLADVPATVDFLAGLAQPDGGGIDGFVFWPSDSGLREVDRWGEDVVPALRQVIE
jgi:alkanesulfonate monooxygenase SsuD/methylene tetrahydromethanopterin reductase-like flavin-dependent oxidoreductase (luciferase family)